MVSSIIAFTMSPSFFLFGAAFLPTLRSQSSLGTSQNPFGSYSEAQCEQMNKQRAIDTHREHQVTKAVMCDTRPAACVSEFLFSHEFYWSEQQAAARGGLKCAKWLRDEDWPTVEPHLARTPDLGGLWEEVLSLLPNRTLWLHGDSIMTQVCEASLCSLARSHVVPQPPLCTFGRNTKTKACSHIDAVARSVGMQLRAVQLPNGARLLCSAVGVLEREKIATVLRKLPEISVAVINYGLHYHSSSNFNLMLTEMMALLEQWANNGKGRVPLWRELSAQHFKGGSWTPGQDKPPPGTPCQCEPLASRGGRKAQGGFERTLNNQNVEFNDLAAAAAAKKSVGIVPFFNLTVDRHDMHRRHFCSYSNQLKVGRCCDCTHLCYTPLFWDHFFRGLRNSIARHPYFVAPGGSGQPALVEDDGGSIGGGGTRRFGRRRGRGRRRFAGAKRTTGVDL